METATTQKVHNLLLLAGLSMKALRDVWIEQQTHTYTHNPDNLYYYFLFGYK